MIRFNITLPPGYVKHFLPSVRAPFGLLLGTPFPRPLKRLPGRSGTLQAGNG